MYCGVSPGFRCGMYPPVDRLNVTSRKFTTFRLVSIVTFSPCPANTAVKLFRMRSAALPVVFLSTAKPSSLYRPICALPTWAVSSWSIYTPTSSHTSAPSNEPMVTSNVLALFFFTQGSPSLNNTDFRACMTISLSPSSMLVYVDAKSRAFARSASVMEG